MSSANGPLRDAPWAHARARARALGHLLPAEDVDVAAADRRVVAGSISALVDLPGFDASAMDGWAVCGEGPWTVVGSVHAGEDIPEPMAAGTALLIATGAPVPRGSDGIVRTERGRVDGTTLSGDPTITDVRRAGQECRAGDVIAIPGTELSPALLGLIAATGHDGVRVTQRPRVQLLVLGDELEQAGRPRVGRVRDALGPQVPAWLMRAGAEVVGRTPLRDAPDALSDAIAAACDSADLIVTTGGTAAGPRDYLRAAIRATRGELVVDEVAVRPGHPMLLAMVGSTPLVALPGNPQAAVVALLTLGFPIIDAMLGRPETALARVPLGEDVPARPGPERLVAGVLLDGAFLAASHTGSAMLRGLASSSGYALLPAAGARAGESVEWLALP